MFDQIRQTAHVGSDNWRFQSEGRQQHQWRVLVPQRWNCQDVQSGEYLWQCFVWKGATERNIVQPFRQPLYKCVIFREVSRAAIHLQAHVFRTQLAHRLKQNMQTLGMAKSSNVADSKL